MATTIVAIGRAGQEAITDDHLPPTLRPRSPLLLPSGGGWGAGSRMAGAGPGRGRRRGRAAAQGLDDSAARRRHGTRRKSEYQLVSHVLPPSGENACSQWAELGVIRDQMKRIRMRLPRSVSSA